MNFLETIFIRIIEITYLFGITNEFILFLVPTFLFMASVSFIFSLVFDTRVNLAGVLAISLITVVFQTLIDNTYLTSGTFTYIESIYFQFVDNSILPLFIMTVMFVLASLSFKTEKSDHSRRSVMRNVKKLNDWDIIYR